MAFEETFGADWPDVLQAPMLAGLAITAADPGGLIGAVRESAALAHSLKSGLDAAADGSLIAEVVAAYGTSDGRSMTTHGLRSLVKGKAPAEACAAAIARLAEIMALVRQKAPGEAPAFAEWLHATAARVAEAASEVGFLGIGGERVSEAERKTLVDLAVALAAPTV
ncbi:hypothetical protein [Tropicimonas sp. IMCC34043]|uniref:hypothetical protein n=1 Tax=Tropicimonas sp. IMCC34043 TaxID=2248760 RepID=UPI001300B49D|nr:hypothetical protein [Tropicimonas sp. IMCC34043]